MRLINLAALGVTAVFTALAPVAQAQPLPEKIEPTISFNWPGQSQGTTPAQNSNATVTEAALVPINPVENRGYPPREEIGIELSDDTEIIAVPQETVNEFSPFPELETFQDTAIEVQLQVGI